jgi:sulfur-oxidizing protein SoxZ
MGIKVIAKVKDNVAEVKLLIKHPMQIANAKTNKTAKYINELLVKHGGKTVYTMYPSVGISENPFIKFMFKGAKEGDKIEVSWKDNTGETEQGEFELK